MNRQRRRPPNRTVNLCRCSVRVDWQTLHLGQETAVTSRNRSSKKSRPRRKPPSPPLSFALSHSDVREAVGPILGDVLAAASGVGERNDPFEAELFAAGLRAALCAAWRVVMDDGDSALGIALARAAEDTGGPAALALLRAVEA